MSCPDAATVQGFVDGTLAEADRAAVEAHVDDCRACRRLLALLVTKAGPTAPDGEPRTAAREPLGLGAIIDRYQVSSYLGKGGMGIVYGARDPELHRDVALKLLRPDSGDGGSPDDARARLLREAQAMAQVAHPNVIGVYDVGTWNGEVFVAMELAPGGTLRTWTAARRRSSAEIVDAYVAAGRGLAAAHAVGLVHRDFKPDNVLVGADGRMRVTDFGLARAHGTPGDAPRPPRAAGPLSTPLTATGTTLGTPGYMAPEQYDGAQTDASTDQFAFCVALWEALHGERPFAGADEDAVARAASTGAITTPAATRIPPALERVLRRGLQPAQADRWPSMDALLAAIADARPRPRSRVPIVATALIAGAAVIAVVAIRPWHAAPTAAAPGMDAAQAPDVAGTAIRMQMLTAEAGWAGGQRADAMRSAEDAVARARASGGKVLLAEMLFAESLMLQEAAELARAEVALHEAANLAAAAGDDRLGAKVIGALVAVLDTMGKHDEAAGWRGMAVATASRPGTDDDTAAEALEDEASSLSSAGDFDAALIKWDAALALRDRNGNSQRHATNRVGAGMTLIFADRLDAARDLLVANVAYLDAHPGEKAAHAIALSGTLVALSRVQAARKQWADAEAAARRSIPITTELVGAESPVLAQSYQLLGAALAGKGDRDGAAAAFARALQLEGDDQAATAMTHGFIAASLREAGRVQDAIPHAEQAVAIGTARAGANDPTTHIYQLLLGKLLVADHQLARARDLLEPLLAALISAKAEATAIADARYALARALPATAHDHAHELAVAALAAYRASSTTRPSYLAEVEAWIAAHP